MSTIGVRELAKQQRADQGAVLTTRCGRPVAYMLAVDSEEFEDFVLAHTPEFVEGMATANAELAAGETVSLADTRGDLVDADQSPSTR